MFARPVVGGWRRWVLPAGLYLVLLLVYALVAGRERLTEHTPFNHFALLAESWLNGRLDLGRAPPDYAQGNDFARYDGKWYVTFPAFPALLLLPLVHFAGSAERVRDGQFFVWLAPIGPVLFFCALEKLRELGRSPRTRAENALLALGLALGSVYFFTAVQGTVWFAAHVVAVALGAAYLLCSLGAARPLLAGLALGLGFLTRPQLVFAAPLFVLEALSHCRREGAISDESGLVERLRALPRSLDRGRVVRTLALFAAPILVCGALAAVHNQLRFDDPFDFGYRHLSIAWKNRIEKWGLWHYHFLAKNLAVVLTSMPWVKPFQINMHGLALWITTPVYLWLLWPKRARGLFAALMITALGVALPGLFYQNTGWLQFGYRFSNDYAVFLLAALAVTLPRLGPLFWAACAWGVAVNAFGAVTFDRAEYRRLYFQEPTQRVLFQPD